MHRVVIDRKTGNYIFVVKKNDSVCPYIILNSKHSRRFAALNVIQKDLDLCRKAFIELIETQNKQIIKMSLLFFAIINYGKCFAKADGRSVMLNSKEAFKGVDNKIIDYHEKLIDIRNNYIAHAGIGNYEQYPFSLTLNPDLNNKKVLGYMVNGIAQIKDHHIYIDKYVEVIEHLESYVNNAIIKVKERLDKEVAALDIDEIYNNSLTPDENFSLLMDNSFDLV